MPEPEDEPAAQESYLEFPAEFPLKAIGGGEGFADWVLAVVRKHVPELAQHPPVTTNPSAGGKYLGVTVTFTATSQAQLNAIYAELGQDPRVRMLL